MDEGWRTGKQTKLVKILFVLIIKNIFKTNMAGVKFSEGIFGVKFREIKKPLKILKLLYDSISITIILELFKY